MITTVLHILWIVVLASVGFSALVIGGAISLNHRARVMDRRERRAHIDSVFDQIEQAKEQRRAISDRNDPLYSHGARRGPETKGARP